MAEEKSKGTALVKLLDLPEELLGFICAELPLPELQNFRLSCKPVANIGLEHLLSSVTVLFTYESIMRLREISFHPVLRKHVKNLVYEGKYLEHFRTKTEWEECIVEKAEFFHLQRPEGDILMSETPYSWTRDEIQEGWAHYKKIRREQEQIFKNDTDKRQIAQAILRFPNLREISVYLPRAASFTLASNYFLDTFKIGLVEPDNDTWYEHREPPGLRQLFTCMYPLMIGPEELASNSQSLGTHVSAVPKVVCFSANEISWMAMSIWDSTFDGIYTSFCELEALKLTFIVGSWDEDDENREMDQCAEYMRSNNGLRKLVASCLKLRVLEIGFSNIDQYENGQAATLSQIVGANQFAQLEMVHFSNFYFNEEDMVTFLKAHKSSLRSIFLNGMCIDREHTWAEFVQHVRNLDIPWRDFGIVGLIWVEGDELFPVSTSGMMDSTEDPTVMIEDFVLKKSNFNPFDGERGLHFTPEGRPIWQAPDDWEWEDIISDNDVD